MVLEITNKQAKEITEAYLDGCSIGQLDTMFSQHIGKFYKQDAKKFKKTVQALREPMEVS